MLIQFPNPDEYLHREDEFFDQLELCLYHAKKAWNKTKEKYTAQDEKEENYPWLSFWHPSNVQDAVEEYKIDGKRVDPDRRELQEIGIEISELL